MMTDLSKEEIDAIINSAEETLQKLDTRLENIRVSVKSSSEGVIEAVSAVFGRSFIKDDGSAEISYDMYKKALNKIREIGLLKVQEYT